MFLYIARLTLILWCLKLPFGIADSVIGDHINYNYRLPNHTKPESYDISFRTHIGEGRFDYDGFIGINILIVNATREVTIHARQLNIKFIRLSSGTGKIDLLPWRSDDRTDFLTIATKFVELMPGDRYRLDIVFTGELRNDFTGFYRDHSSVHPTNQTWIALTKFAPISARTAFPCYDEPGFKAHVNIEITHGASYSAVSMMPGARSENFDGTVTTRFGTTPLISTYLIEFAVIHRQTMMTDENSTSPMHAAATAANSTNYAMSRFALDLCERILKVMEKYLQGPYAAPKMDQIYIVNMFKENAIQVPFNESEDSLDKKMSFAGQIAREISTQWFGHIVTAKWWSDAWLNQGFAMYFEKVAVESIYSGQDFFDGLNGSSQMIFCEYNHDQRTWPLMRHVDDPYTVRDHYKNLEIYESRKSPCVIRMMSKALTESIFLKGLKHYLAINAYGAVDEDDLFEALDSAAKEGGTLDSSLSVKEIFSSWTHLAGFPILIVTRNYENGSITLSQQGYGNYGMANSIYDPIWWIPYNYATAKSPSFDNTLPNGWLHQRSELIQPTGNDNWAPSEWIVFNKQQTGYYRVMYDMRNWELLIDELISGPNNTIPPRIRWHLLENIFTFVMDGHLHDYLLIEAVRYLSYETEYEPWSIGIQAILYLDQSDPSFQRFHRKKTISVIESAKMLITKKVAVNISHSLLKTQEILDTLSCYFEAEDSDSVCKDLLSKMNVQRPHLRNIGYHKIFKF